MGAVSSTPRGDANPKDHGDYLLGVLVGNKSYDVDSNLWDRLLGLPLTLQWPESVVHEACESMVQNSIFTSHLSKLFLHLAWSLHEVLHKTPLSHVSILKTINAVRFSSTFLKHLIEHGSNEQLMSCLSLSLSEKEAKATGNQNVAGLVISAIFSFIGNLDVNPSTYMLHLEVVNLLLVMLSTQLHSRLPYGTKDFQIFFDAAMAQDLSVVQLAVRKLLLSYIAKLPMPASVAHYMNLSKVSQQGVLQKVGAAAATVLKLPYYTYNYLLSSNNPTGPSPLAQNGLLLLLVLVHYRKCSPADEIVHEKFNGKGDVVAVPNESDQSFLNPFSQALELARDTEFDLIDIETDAAANSVARVPFAALYDTLGLCLKDESSVLLLYSLVHGNRAFLEYVLVRTDIDTLLMPVLEMLYDASRKTSKQIYMLLIILLILSQDASFNASIHKLVLPAVPWYKERLLNQTSLGSLMVVILIRTVKYNLSKLRDVYLHTNCLAVLSNMAPHVHRLNAYGAQRLVSLFDMLSRKYMKLADAHGRSADTRLSMENVVEAGDDAPTDLLVYTDFLRIVLEIINAILSYALPRNPEVVYALLHQQELFQPFRNHPRFYELIENLYTVLDFFNARMDAHSNDAEWSVEKVLEIVIANTRSWRGEGMKMFTQLRFTYEEELHPEEFFVPYVWQLVVSNSGINWDLNTITLFPSRIVAEVERVESFSDKTLDIPTTPSTEL
ncbi:hypothetical protein KP509_09G062000 [Ceratopteris richardii]|uniref:Dymeclin n=1 Tax=Ceratopteris richardii TaxID=49495 RepID=A0A8T2U1U5_CERRI|nr:hypothetical protein KP509_09G062000 [Ceratopteris richardii]